MLSAGRITSTYGRQLTSRVCTCVFKRHEVTSAEFQEVDEVRLEDALPPEQIPGPRIWPITGTLHTAVPKFGEYDGEHLVQSHLKLYKKYGPVVRQRYGSINIVQLFDTKDAEKLRRVEGKYPLLPPLTLFKRVSDDMGTCPNLIAAQGEDWHRQRMAMQRHVMKPRVVAAYMPTQEQVATDMVDMLRRIRDDKHEVKNVLESFSKYAVEAIGLVCYAKRLGTFEYTEDNKDKCDGYIVMANCRDMTDNIYLLLVTQDFFKYGMFKGQYKKYLTAAKTIREVTLRLVDEYQKIMQDGVDTEDCIIRSLLEDPNITHEETINLIDQLLWGGVDTTAISLTHFVHQMVLHPDIQDKIHEEICRVLPDNKPTTYQAMQNDLKYLRAVVREMYRLCPASPISYSRRLDHDEVFGGYRVPAGWSLMVQTAAMGRLPHYFEDPDVFKPERWLEDKNRELYKMASSIIQPFGYGKRSCLGRRFAEQELYLAMIGLCRNFKMEYYGKPLGTINRTFIELDGPLNVVFKDR